MTARWPSRSSRSPVDGCDGQPDDLCVAEARTQSSAKSATFSATGGADNIVIVDGASTGSASAFSLAATCP